jgi:anti-sigma regulatory factor (Ser/Thr protein kinase)
MAAGTVRTQIPDVTPWKDTTLRRSEEAARQARQAVNAWLAHSHSSVRFDMLQVVSELVSNAIKHVPAGPQRDWLRVRLGVGAGFVRLEVIDPGTSEPQPCFAPLRLSSLEVSGRGLGIVAALSVRCGTHLVDHGHRVVWADLADARRALPAVREPAGRALSP